MVDLIGLKLRFGGRRISRGAKCGRLADDCRVADSRCRRLHGAHCIISPLSSTSLHGLLPMRFLTDDESRVWAERLGYTPSPPQLPLVAPCALLHLRVGLPTEPNSLFEFSRMITGRL